ncbi:MAG: NACHT domain-containing protein, partial [Cytophagales bacterium]|nr:NACHT domain-containing protein [Cytophagales bacterium]
MPETIIDQTIDFYNELFDYIFSQPFLPKIKERLKRNAVKRQVEEAADAASQSLTRFFLNQQVSEPQVADIFSGFSRLKDLLKLEDIANPNDTPESVVELLLVQIPCPEGVQCSGNDAVYRVALHSVVQVLMQIGSVMAEWEKVNFSTTFELPQRVVNRLNAISKQLDAIGKAGQDAADYNYEITYRDYLLQRFNRVEAGTVRMTTNMDVDLRELFVMPRVHVRPALKKDECDLLASECDLMDLTQARRIFKSILGFDHKDNPEKKEDDSITAFDQVLKYPRNVIIGAPGSGKSTFLEWLQIMLASVEQELIMGDQQAIPLLLRVRQMDIQKLPANGAEMIGLATASNDWAALMPYSWLERQMQEGRVFIMLDGLDETEPDMRDKFVIPWFYDLFQKYPDCHYLISSRPAGYPFGMLLPLQFTECDLLDFNNDDIAEYTCHWCTAVRLAQNELEAEARKEGKTDGEQIFEGFKNHPYICNLARNPLMLSAICLVNYFEGSKLPEDRALLYKLCVEGLLHNWDQRRGIHSPFRLDEKLRACREVALAMQAEDSAEIETETVGDIFSKVLNDSARAKNLLQHIRHRTGLLIERRAGIFAFAHLTFQEYLAACAVYEGNQIGINAEQLVNEHDDARWKEVIALYCGIAPAPIACAVIEQLIAHNDTKALSSVLADAYLSAGQELFQDHAFRQKVLERIAVAPNNYALKYFSNEEVAPIANR